MSQEAATLHLSSVIRHALLVALVSLAMFTAQAGTRGQAPRASRPTAPTSDLLLHSPLVRCAPGAGAARSQSKALRVATWNIRAALSAPVDELAAELRSMKADIAGLQEVDFRARRSGLTEQAPALATALAAHYVFAASIEYDGGDYGLALLSNWPLVEVRRHRLDPVGVGEPRIVLEVIVCASGRPLRVFNHHADVGSRSRESGFARLRELVAPHVGAGVVVLGDFNDAPAAPGIRALLALGLVDIGAEQNAPTSGGGRIDYLLLDAPLAKRARSTQVWPTRKSDHHALITEFDW